MEDGTTVPLFIDPQPSITTGNAVLARRASLLTRHGEFRMQNENVHAGYWEAFQRNLAHLAVFSGERTVLSYRGVFKKMQVLDTAMYYERGVSPDGKPEGINSGLYIVGTVSRELTGRQFGTTLELFREAPSQVRGNFRVQAADISTVD